MREEAWPGSRYRTLLWLVLAAGVLVRLVLAFTTDGVRPDLESFRVVEDALDAAPGQVYTIANSQPPFVRWPYPPGFLPAILGADGVAALTSLDFLSVIRIPSILADAAIAWVVQDFLGRRGHEQRTRLAAAALVALGPSFVAVSGFHGQIDAVAILPAALALAAWERVEGPARPYVAGLLLGLGGSIKTVPLFLVLALLPTARSWREGIRLAASAALVPLAALAPFLIADGTDLLRVFRYNGAPGLGGLSLVAQPDLAPAWFDVGDARVNGVSQTLFDASRTITAVALAAAAVLLLMTRAPAPLAAVVLWLTVYVFGVTFFMQYMVWGLPFFLMAGYVRQVLVLEAVLLPPVLVTYMGASEAWEVWVFYVVPMAVVWAGMVLALAWLARGLLRGRPRGPPHRPDPAPAVPSAS